jgi:chromosome partitioning protein
MLVSLVSQKGGVGKSSLARTLAAEFTKHGWDTLLADTDYQQSTSFRWCERRKSDNTLRSVESRLFRLVSDAIRADNSDYDLVILDGAPQSSKGTLDAARASTLTIIPTGTSVDDLEPAIKLANELSGEVDSKIVFVLMKSTSDFQERESRETIENLGFTVLGGAIPMKSGYIEALDKGFALTETKYDSLNSAASRVMQSAINLIGEM